MGGGDAELLRLIAKGASCLAVSLSRGEMPLQLSLGFAQGCAGDSLPGSSVRDCRGATSLPFAETRRLQRWVMAQGRVGGRAVGCEGGGGCLLACTRA